MNGILQGKLTVMNLSVLLRETHCLVQKVGLDSCMQKHTGEETEMENLCIYVYVTSLRELGKTFT